MEYNANYMGGAIVLPSDLLREIGVKRGDLITIKTTPSQKAITVNKLSRKDEWVTKTKKKMGAFDVDFVILNRIIVCAVCGCEYIGMGVAVCHENDKYDEQVGKCVAFAKALGENIPDYI